MRTAHKREHMAKLIAEAVEERAKRKDVSATSEPSSRSSHGTRESLGYDAVTSNSGKREQALTRTAPARPASPLAGGT